MAPLIHLLAQMKIENWEGRNPPLGPPGTSGMTWIIAAVLTAGILLITFKTSKRNHLDRD